MTMVTFSSRGSLKLVRAILFITLLVQYLRPALGFISGVGVGDANNIRCLEGERQALLEFRKGLIDDYGRLSSWRGEDENKNCCNWEGVLCSNQTGHVLKLHLSGSQDDGMQPFRGMISPSLFELPYLTFLDLSSNDFNQSHIPKFIGSLNHLKHLDLSWANFSGPIPHQLENLSHLQYLNLGGNDLKIIENLKWLSHMSTIEYLDLSATNLSVVANDWLEVVSHLPNLKTLSLWLCDLPPLSQSSLPRFNYSKSFAPLETLDLHHNQFVHIPKSFGDICTLRELYLSSNNFNGQLIELMNNLSGCAKNSLEVLDLSENHITGSLPNFSIFPSLKNLNLSKNELNGTLPKSIGNLYNLKLLSISSNNLQGVISDSFFSNFSKLRAYLSKLDSNARKVSFLEISDANISDTIPAEWLEDLPSTLMDLNISSNQIHGQLPNVLTKGLNGLAIDLSSNRIDGTLPLFPTNLTFLNLSKNRFSGSISSLCKINAQLLAFLDLSDNILSGRLPNCFMHWRKLIVLNLAVMDLGRNRFSGKVPAWIGEGLPRLFSLSLHSNKFAGSIPLHLCWLKDLQIFDLSLNDISGTIPQCLNNFTGMTRGGTSSVGIIKHFIPYSYYNGITYGKEYVDSAMVIIKGSEHTYSKLLQLIKIIDLSRKKLTGKLPSEILSLSGLLALNISRNNLIGEIPQMIGQLGSLESLDLSWNKISGEIPFSMSNLTFLLFLNLSYNNLSGKIPLSPQLQSCDAFAFVGNPALCGPPLTQLCPGEETPNQSKPMEDGLAPCNNDSERVKIAEKVSDAGMTTFCLARDGCIAVLKAKRLIRVKYVAATGCSRQNKCHNLTSVWE
uniref:Leucine-rich repeat-containing N-terminal plant-type domain-containing protein n=1 Tax=Quercus lobata TaxID=97700 RepID=A0A7N2MKU5_QUELO